MSFKRCQQYMTFAFSLGVGLLLGGAPLIAQTDRATLEGTVTDPSGGTISGANVSVTAVDTGISQERKTNSSGYYRFPGLPVGQFTVTVSNISFKTKVIEQVILQVGETHTLDVSLVVGEVAEKVEIKAETGLAERTSAAAATVISTTQIANLPVNGRDWSALTLLAPFAQDDGGGNQRTIRYAGRAIDDNNFNFDGVDAGGIQEQAQKSQVRLQISEDAIAEYRVSSALSMTPNTARKRAGRSTWLPSRARTISMEPLSGTLGIPYLMPATSTISISMGTRPFRLFALVNTV